MNNQIPTSEDLLAKMNPSYQRVMSGSHDRLAPYTPEEIARHEHELAITAEQNDRDWQVNTIRRAEAKRLGKQKDLVIGVAASLLMQKVMANPYIFMAEPGKVHHISEAPGYVKAGAASAEDVRRQAQ